MTRKLTALGALGAFLAIQGVAAPAFAADVRPGVVAAAGSSLAKPVALKGRAAAPTEAGNSLIGAAGPGAFVVGGLGLAAFGFAIYKVAKGSDSPTSP